MTEDSTITENLALRWKQQRVNVLPGVTARGLAALLDGFDRGILKTTALAWDEMIERDDTLSVCVPKYIDQVASQPWDVLIGEEVPDEQRAEAERHQAALKYFYSNLGYEDALDRNFESDVEMVIRRTVQARFYRYSAQRIIWQPATEGLTAVIRYCNLALFDNSTGKLRWAGVDGATPGVAINDPENWLIAASDRCLMKALSICYMFKRLPMQDALNFCQRFGIPAVHGETQARPGSKEWDDFVRALKCFANDLTIATALGDKFNILPNSAANGEQVFGWIIEAMKRAMVTITLGSDLKTMSRENGAGASLQGDDGDLMTAAGCRFVTGVFNRQLDRRIIADQFGEGTKPLAFFKLIPPQNQDVEMEMKVDDHVTKLGVKLSVADVAERFNRTHDDSAADEPGPANDAANESAAQLRRLEDHERRTFFEAAKRDARPVINALLPLNAAQGADATRNALHALAANQEDLTAQVIDQDSGTQAMEVIVATEFLRGLAGGQGDAEAGNAGNPYHDARGRFTHGGASRELGGTSKGDAFGPLPAEGGHLTPDQNFERGTRAARWVTRGKGAHVVRNAMHVKGLGQITFAWGNSGKKDNDHKSGYGLYHIIDKHGASAARALPHTLAYGRIYPHPDGAHKKLIFDGTNLAVLAREPRSNHLAITSFERPDKKYLASLGIHT